MDGKQRVAAPNQPENRFFLDIATNLVLYSTWFGSVWVNLHVVFTEAKRKPVSNFHASISPLCVIWQ